MSSAISFLPSELKLWVNTPHGRGRVLCVEPFAHDNYIFTIILEAEGRIRHYNSCDLNACQDMTDGVNVRDVKPIVNDRLKDCDIPTNLKTDFNKPITASSQ